MTTLSLADFYQSKLNWLPDNLQQNIGHFNVFRLADFVGHAARPVPYSRKDFYKISLIQGQNTYHYADKSIAVERNALLFATPLVPYQWEPRSDEQGGFFCIFTEAFLQRYLGSRLADFPVFRPGGQPVFFLDDAQVAATTVLFEKMFTELASDYSYKYDLLRAYVLELIHSAQRLQPITTLYRESNAATRLASLFTELLERQFPIESPRQRVRLRAAAAYADQLAVHVNHLNRALKEVTGKTTTVLLAERFALEAQSLLRYTDWPISLVSYCLGFEEPAHFNNFFRKHIGTTPRNVRAAQG